MRRVRGSSVARLVSRSTSGAVGVWPPLPPSVYVRRPSSEHVFPLGEPNCRLFALGRHALWQGVRALGIGAGDEILVPAYHHGSEVEALVRAGVVCRFYAGSEGLEPDEGELEALLGPRVRALLLIHYLGFPQRAFYWRRWCDERQLLLIEDAAQAWLATVDGRPVGSIGDVGVFCLYKTFGLPDGAALVSPSAAPIASTPAPTGAGGVVRRHAAWMRARFRPRPGRTGLRDDLPSPASEEFGLGDPFSSPTAATIFLLPRIARHAAAERRRANYRFLLDRFGDRVSRPFADLPSGASPFVFPIETARKRLMLRRLEDAGIRAFDFWSVGHPALPHAKFVGADSRRAQTIGLPVHQELRPRDVEWIAKVVAAALGDDAR